MVYIVVEEILSGSKNSTWTFLHIYPPSNYPDVEMDRSFCNINLGICFSQNNESSLKELLKVLAFLPAPSNGYLPVFKNVVVVYYLGRNLGKDSWKEYFSLKIGISIYSESK